MILEVVIVHRSAAFFKSCVKVSCTLSFLFVAMGGW